MRKDCDNCKHKDCWNYAEPCNSCTDMTADGTTNWEPQSNADWIRAMTDEQLAGFVCDRSCAYCPMDDCDGRMTIGRDACYKRWLDWLRQEVDDAGDHI